MQQDWWLCVQCKKHNLVCRSCLIEVKSQKGWTATLWLCYLWQKQLSWRGFGSLWWRIGAVQCSPPQWLSLRWFLPASRTRCRQWCIHLGEAGEQNKLHINRNTRTSTFGSRHNTLYIWADCHPKLMTQGASPLLCLVWNLGACFHLVQFSWTGVNAVIAL